MWRKLSLPLQLFRPPTVAQSVLSLTFSAAKSISSREQLGIAILMFSSSLVSCVFATICYLLRCLCYCNISPTLVHCSITKPNDGELRNSRKSQLSLILILIFFCFSFELIFTIFELTSDRFRTTPL